MKERPTGPVMDGDEFEIASASECTGLMPTTPKTSGELAAYRNLAPQPKAVKGKNKKK